VGEQFCDSLYRRQSIYLSTYQIYLPIFYFLRFIKLVFFFNLMLCTKAYFTRVTY